MKRLTKIHTDPAGRKTPKSNDGFVFSDDIAKWMSSTSPTTVDRRKKHKEVVRKPKVWK